MDRHGQTKATVKMAVRNVAKLFTKACIIVVKIMKAAIINIFMIYNNGYMTMCNLKWVTPGVKLSENYSTT